MRQELNANRLCVGIGQRAYIDLWILVTNSEESFTETPWDIVTVVGDENTVKKVVEKLNMFEIQMQIYVFIYLFT